MSKSAPAGRPAALTGLAKVNALRSIKVRGLLATQAKLAAQGVRVSLGTLHNYARKAGIVLKQGRRPKAAKKAA